MQAFTTNKVGNTIDFIVTVNSGKHQMCPCNKIFMNNIWPCIARLPIAKPFPYARLLMRYMLPERHNGTLLIKKAKTSMHIFQAILLYTYMYISQLKLHEIEITITN